uniref:Uncharacterized protein n=1 Tax=Amphimedon queenslandica TaxID=400682 RepID=A0A1X7SNM1_AMPQE
MSSFFIIIFD